MPESDAKPGMTSFCDLGLSEPLIRVLDEIGYETPTAIQSQAIPLLMKGRDILGHAPTGTGKTATAELAEKLEARGYAAAAVSTRIKT